MDIERTLHWLLAERMHANAVTQRILVERTGLSRPYVWRILAGKRPGTLEVWGRLLDAAGPLPLDQSVVAVGG